MNINDAAINDDEIDTAIELLGSRKSVGKDGITAEVIKQNTKWLTHILEIIFQNCRKQIRCRKDG